MDVGWIVILVMAGIFALVLWILCAETRRRERWKEYWNHPPDLEVKYDDEDPGE